MAAGRIVRSALLLSSVASGMRKARTQTSTADETQDEPGERIGCRASQVVSGPLEALINAQVERTLSRYDPANVNLGTISRQIQLPLCPADMRYDVTMGISNLKTARVGGLQCDSSECVEQGPFGICRKEIFKFKVNMAFAEVIKYAGYADGNWSLCGLFNSPRRVDMGFEAADGRIDATVNVEYERALPPKAEIIGVTDAKVTFGRYQNYQCGFSTLPGLVGEPLEAWCSAFGTWMLERIETWAKGPIEAAVNALLNKYLNLPADAQSVEYVD